MLVLYRSPGRRRIGVMSSGASNQAKPEGAGSTSAVSVHGGMPRLDCSRTPPISRETQKGSAEVSVSLAMAAQSHVVPPTWWQYCSPWGEDTKRSRATCCSSASE